MSYRKTPFVPGEIYHVFNRSIAHEPIFLTQNYYHRAMDVLEFYSYCNPPLRFSHYNRLPIEQKADFFDSLKKNHKKQIELLAFCLMPNHLHFLIKEIEKNGIRTFMSNFQNSFAKYFNLKKEREGSLFQAMFKGIRIETDEQLLHVCRYIHLNPLTSFILKDFKALENYPWSSFAAYINKYKFDILEKNTILSYFSSVKKFAEFTKDQVDYQRKLKRINHLLLE